MGDRLGQEDGYPAGTSNADPTFHEPDPADHPCVCGHDYDQHCDAMSVFGAGECDVADCDCTDYEPEGTDYSG